MEKVYTPFVYLAKKCYFAKMYMSPNDTPTTDIKGIAVVRGDTSTFTRDIQLQVIDAILNNPHDPLPVVRRIMENASDRVKQTDKAEFIKSKKLNANYKNPDGQIQVQVARKMKERGQEAPQVGDKVEYLVSKGNKKQKISERADHPDYVDDLDFEYYVKTQLTQPLSRTLKVVKYV
jgi:DNA polymerase delta subunit 1